MFIKDANRHCSEAWFPCDILSLHHSTDTCLSYLTDKVKIGFEEGLLTGMVLIDLQKAFDTIDHSILLEKMRCLGFAGKNDSMVHVIPY